MDEKEVGIRVRKPAGEGGGWDEKEEVEMRKRRLR